MNRKFNSEFERLADFLFEEEGDSEISSASKLRLEKCISEQLERANKISKRSWISRAQAERKKFEESAKNIVSSLTEKYGSRADLVSAIQNGLLGGGIQQRYLLGFRNRRIDELSDEDLRSIIGDQEILELLKKFKGEPKK